MMENTLWSKDSSVELKFWLLKLLQYSTDELVKEVENYLEEFKRRDREYDEEQVKQQVLISHLLLILVLTADLFI